MKKVAVLLCTALIALTTSVSKAQNSVVPALSPAASVSQTFGITSIQINYCSPGVKGRTIWGGLVPYDSVWRTGANAATTISFSTDVTVGGKTIKAGRYALFTIPGKENWTIIINADADQWGAFSYKKADDIVRFMVKPSTADFKERMAFYIDPTSDSTCSVSLHWEKLKISFDVKANTVMMIQKSVDNTWRTLANAANYYVDNKLNLAKAYDWAEASIKLQESFFNRYVMARVLQAQGNNKEALKYAEEAKTLGTKEHSGLYDEYQERIEKLIAKLGGDKK